MTEVRASSVRFYSPMDEDSFFAWLNKLISVKEIYGDGKDIVFSLENNDISDHDFHEMIAVFRRYNVDMRQLRILVNKKNQDWVKSWEPSIFL
jgi:hypothetical protein